MGTEQEFDHPGASWRFRVYLGFQLQVEGFGFRLRLRVQGSGFKFRVFGIGSGFRVSGFGSRVWVLGFDSRGFDELKYEGCITGVQGQCIKVSLG